MNVKCNFLYHLLHNIIEEDKYACGTSSKYQQPSINYKGTEVDLQLHLQFL